MKHDIDFTPIIDGKFVTQKPHKARRFNRQLFIINATLISISVFLCGYLFWGLFYKLFA